MSIQSEIDRISAAVNDAYDAVSEMGGGVDAYTGVDDLGDAIRAIPKGLDLEFDPSLTLSDDNVLSVTEPTKSATKEEFDAMTDDQKKGLVVVTDEDSSVGGGSSKDIYSTEETVIGVWIDGKPLYRRVVVIENAPSSINANVYYDVGLSEVDTMCVIEGQVKRNTQQMNSPINTGWTYAAYDRGSKKLALWVQNAVYVGEWTITLEYTKTTD